MQRLYNNPKKEVGGDFDFLHAVKSFLQVHFNLKVFYKVTLSLLMGMIKHSQSTQSHSNVPVVLIKDRINKSILIESCDHTICLGLSLPFVYAPAHKAYIFEFILVFYILQVRKLFI